VVATIAITKEVVFLLVGITMKIVDTMGYGLNNVYVLMDFLETDVKILLLNLHIMVNV